MATLFRYFSHSVESCSSGKVSAKTLPFDNVYSKPAGLNVLTLAYHLCFYAPNKI